MTTKSKFSAAGKGRAAAYDRDPAYEANPYDPFEDITTPRKRRRQRSLSLARVIACAKQAGANVIINADGSRTIVTCPTDTHVPVATGAHAPFDINDWDGAL